MKQKISIIAAIGKNRELGKGNKMLWYIPEDFKRFKKLTMGHPVIMGRKTFESIGRVLPGRINIIVTRNTKYVIPNTKNVVIAKSLEDAIEMGKKINKDELFIIGGGQIYEQAIQIADKLYLTLVEARLPASEAAGNGGQADTFFPDYSEFKKVVFEEKGESGDYTYTFLELKR